jgi:hypothetical protein
VLSEPAPTQASRLHFVGVSLDCDDPASLAAFYRDLLGGQLLWSNERSAAVQAPGVLLVPQRVDGYRPPQWPGAAVVHLDLSAGDQLDEPAHRALNLGATLAQFQPDERWRVLLDPAGHPFCITSLAAPQSGGT